MKGFINVITSMTSPDGNDIGKIISEGTSVVSLQWIRVSSKSKTTVLKSKII